MNHSLRILRAVALCAAALFAVSCTQDKLEIINSIVCPVFSFDSASSSADMHLCAYVQTRTEPGYLKLMQIDSDSTGYRWTVSEFQYICSMNGKWAGSSSIYMPRRAPFPEGRVKLTAVNADSQTVEKTYNISYPKNLLTIDYNAFLRSEDYQKVAQQYIVFYNAEGAIINCKLMNNANGNATEEAVPEAVTSRTLSVAKDRSFAVLSPPVALAVKSQK